MAGLITGKIPTYYREVFDALSPDGSSRVSKEIWVKSFKTSKLPPTLLTQVWKECDPGENGYLDRDGVYKSMALCALGQQGKGVELKTLVNMGDVELPQPDLASLGDIRRISTGVLRATNPTELNYSYEELKALDEVSVTVMPEKKGMVFKHVEYLVESKALKSSVRRRYKDFEAFSEALLTKYPYRLIPRMPPKKLTPSPAFIEQRRRDLKRFMVLVVRHPVLSRDEVVQFFFTAGGQDIGSKLKDKFRLNHDEFLFNPHARNIEELVSDATRVKFERVTEQICLMQQIVSSMLQVAHNMENRSLSLSQDLKTLSSSMGTLATDNLLMSSWTSGADDTWSYMQRDCEHLAVKFGALSDKARQQSVRETSGFTESVHLFLDLINSYLDLCERRERTVQRKHQKALTKVQTMVNYKERMESAGKHVSDKDDSRILRRDDELIVIEKRNFFSLFCLDLEAQLVHINLTQLTEVYEHLVNTQVKGHVEYLSCWDEAKGQVEGMKGRQSKPMAISSASPTSSLTSSRSPPRPSMASNASPFS